MPGWPTASKSPLRGIDIAGREVLSLETHDFKSKVGGFRALDYFGDGSFYILNAPGVRFHTRCSLLTVYLPKYSTPPVI